MMTGNINLFKLFLITFVFIFILGSSKLTLGKDLSVEFKDDESKIQRYSSGSSKSQSLAKSYLKNKKWKNGFNKREKGEFFLSIGTAGIQSNNGLDDFADARQDAFDIALLQAKKSFIKFLGQQILTQIVSERKSGKYANPLPKNKNEIENFLNELDTFSEGKKVRILINLELDKALKDAGYENSTTPEAIEEAQKIIKKKSFNKTIEASAEHRLAGFQTFRVFENSDGEKGSITVIGIWSEKLNKLADALVSGGDTPINTPKKPLEDQVPLGEEAEKWLFNFGPSMTTDENGALSIISYGHASPLMDEVDEWTDACDQAILQAESFIAIFANENARYKENLNKSTDTSIFEKESKVAEMKIEKKSVKSYYKKLESVAIIKTEGIVPIGWPHQIKHPSGALECIAAVGWSADLRQSGEDMNKTQKKAEKIKNQTIENDSVDSSGTAYEGESDEASEDF
jgi:hypothetical protein